MTAREDQRQTYREESWELLTELESCLLELEQAPSDTELIGRVFRAMHTIKGSGAMFGFDDIAAFTHEMESVYDLVRGGSLTVTKSMVDLSLAACDQIRRMVDGDPVNPNTIASVVDAFKQMNPEAAPDQWTAQATKAAGQTVAGEPVTYRIRFVPHQDLFASGANPVLLLDELSDMGDAAIVARTGRVPPLEDLDPEACYLSWDIILTTGAGVEAIKDVFVFVEDQCDLSIKIIAEAGIEPDNDACKRLGEILMEKGDVTDQDLRRALDAQKPVGQVLMAARAIDGDTLGAALAEQQHVKQVLEERSGLAKASSLRVSTEKLDALVDLVGEMVTVQARLSQEAASRADSGLTAIAEEVERLTAELRDNTLSIRMVRIGTTFNRFRRLVRDLSVELGKNVVMTTDGGDTELDKTVIDRLHDPMVHIIRNCIDHGIERPEVRTAAGKPAEGSVHLSASHSGGYVLIRVSDDGAGLNTEAIRVKAMEKGLLAPDADPDEKAIHSLLFSPGFSTAERVTDVSGRGVGMDVVKRSIESLRGSIEMVSTAGSGTTITLKLPLTLAIIDGFMVGIGEDRYILPLSAVEECVELTRAEAATVRARGMMNVRGAVVSYSSLRDPFAVGGERPDMEKVVITRCGHERVGLGVDAVVGQHQTVIKSLGRACKDLDVFSGATITGDGSVALIIDTDKLGVLLASDAL